jgi:hypothetical protein
MKCGHLSARGNRAACSALETRYVPSRFELGEYCKTGDHRKCPFYLKGIISVNRPEMEMNRTAY